MSNRRQKSGWVNFAQNHIRISPRTLEDLYALENDQLYELTFMVYDNRQLFTQFSPTWQRRIRIVRNYTSESYFTDSVLIMWAEFFRRVLIPMEDRWEKGTQDNLDSQMDTDLQHRLLLIDLVDHSALEVYIQKEAQRGTVFNVFLASANQARDALRWCNLYEKIQSNQYFLLYQNDHPELVLSSCSYLQLMHITNSLSAYERKAQLIMQIIEDENAINLLRQNDKKIFETGKSIWNLSERRLRIILTELKSMTKSGLFFDDEGNLVAKNSV